MGRNSKLHLQLTARSWRRADASRPGTGVVATDRGPLLTWESSRGQSGGSGLLVCYGLDESSGGLAAPLPWTDAGAHSHVAEVARSTLADPRDGVDRRDVRVERTGDPVGAVPRPERERLVLLLPCRAVPHASAATRASGSGTSTSPASTRRASSRGSWKEPPRRACGRPGRSWPTSARRPGRHARNAPPREADRRSRRRQSSASRDPRPPTSGAGRSSCCCPRTCTWRAGRSSWRRRSPWSRWCRHDSSLAWRRSR